LGLEAQKLNESEENIFFSFSSSLMSIAPIHLKACVARLQSTSFHFFLPVLPFKVFEVFLEWLNVFLLCFAFTV
jgi:hypothetical protein